MKPVVLIVGRGATLRRAGRYLPAFHIRGSDLMRARQLAENVGPLLLPAMTVKAILPHPALKSLLPELIRRQRPNVVILLKSLAYELNPETLQKIRDNAALVVDHIDGNLEVFPVTAADVHVAASLRGYRVLEAQCKGTASKPALLHHHVDPRLGPPSQANHSHFSVAYFGHVANLRLPDRLSERVRVYSVGTSRNFERILPAFGMHPMHYNVRPAETGSIAKPFLKGFTAAHCRANILLTSDVDDARELLGEDYPYFIPDRSEAAISEGLDKAATDFGGPDWRDGLERMSALLEKVTPEAQAAQVANIVELALAMR